MMNDILATPIAIKRIKNDIKLTMDDLDREKIKAINNGPSEKYILDAINLVAHNLYLLSHYELPEKWPIIYLRPVSDNIYDPLEWVTGLQKKKDNTIMNICQTIWLLQFVKTKPGLNGNIFAGYNIEALSCKQLITYGFMNNLASCAKGKRCLTINSLNCVIGAQLLERGIDVTLTTPDIDTIWFGGYHIKNYWDHDNVKLMNPIDALDMAAKDDYNFIIIDNPVKDPDLRKKFINRLAKFIYSHRDTDYLMQESVVKDLAIIIGIDADSRETSIRLSENQYYTDRYNVDPYFLCRY